MHLGNARTALLAWLQVRQAGGRLTLRMDDLDPARSRPDLAAQILTDLRWLGLDWDEGPDVGGPAAPYAQSQRAGRYRAALDRLVAAGQAYPCYCSRADIARAAAAPHAGEEGPPYPGTCRTPDPGRAAAAARRGMAPSWRFRVPDGAVSYADGVHGTVRRDVAAQTGDFIIWSRDGHAAYQLAVVVDDAAMGVTDVLRGDDLVDSTPRQILLYGALGHTPPRFAHVPLLLGPDGGRLAKRHGTVALAGLRAAGVAPDQVVAFLAGISGLWRAGDGPCRPADLIGRLDLARLPRDPVRVNPERLTAG